MKSVAMKVLVLLSVMSSAPIAFAKGETGGFFACVSESGVALTAAVDGEANVENLLLNQTKALEIINLSISDSKLEARLLHRMEEEGVVYSIRAEKKNRTADGTLTISAGDGPSSSEKVTCALKFKAAI